MRHIFDDASRVAVSCCFLDGSPRCFFKVFPSVIAVSHQVSFFSNKNETSHYKNISPPSAVILYGPLLVVKFTPAVIPPPLAVKFTPPHPAVIPPPSGGKIHPSPHSSHPSPPPPILMVKFIPVHPAVILPHPSGGKINPCPPSGHPQPYQMVQYIFRNYFVPKR